MGPREKAGKRSCFAGHYSLKCPWRTAYPIRTPSFGPAWPPLGSARNQTGSAPSLAHPWPAPAARHNPTRRGGSVPPPTRCSEPCPWVRLHLIFGSNVAPCMASMAEGRMAESCDEPFHKGRVSWFNPDKKFGLVVLDDGRGDAFLHMFALKEAVSVP